MPPFRIYFNHSLLLIALLIHAISSIDDDICPICHMATTEEGSLSQRWYVEMAYGQRIYTCSMTDGTEYMKGRHYFSHPALLAARMGEYIRDDKECENSCLKCEKGDVKDPSNGNIISKDKFSFVCFKYGQKLFFSSTSEKSSFLAAIKDIPFLYVSRAVCDDKPCPDSWRTPPQREAKTPDNSHTHVPDSDSLLTNTSESTSTNGFCSGATAMFNGFMSTSDNSCVLLLFQPWVLNTKIKYALGLFGVFFLAVANEALVSFRGYVKGRIQFSLKSAKMTMPYSVSSTFAKRGKYERSKFLGRVILAMLYMVQMALAYFLMLVAMTYETGLFIMLVLGFGAGFLLFKQLDDVAGSGKPEVAEASELEDFSPPPGSIVLNIGGMMCMKNCGNAVQNALSIVPGVEKAQVLFSERQAFVVGNVKPQSLIDAVEAIGFEASLQDQAPQVHPFSPSGLRIEH